MYVLGIALAVTVVDQLTKYAIHQAMVLHESIPVIPGFFHIRKSAVALFSHGLGLIPAVWSIPQEIAGDALGL